MSAKDWDDVTRESIESVNRVRGERCDAAWRPFEEKWGTAATAQWDAQRKAKKGKRRRGTPAAAEPDNFVPGMAREAARTAFEENFESRRGIRVLEDVWGGYTLCIVYNNNPYSWRPIRRDQELVEFRRWVAEYPYTVAELAYAEYPDRGEGEGYTYALLLVCDPGWEDDIADQYEAVTLRSMSVSPNSGDGEAAAWDE